MTNWYPHWDYWVNLLCKVYITLNDILSNILNAYFIYGFTYYTWLYFTYLIYSAIFHGKPKMSNNVQFRDVLNIRKHISIHLYSDIKPESNGGGFVMSEYSYFQFEALIALVAYFITVCIVNAIVSDSFNIQITALVCQTLRPTESIIHSVSVPSALNLLILPLLLSMLS